MSQQQQNPLERAVDLFVFAPIGVAMFAKDTVPTFMKMFVSRGQTELAARKKSLSDHANQYRTVGKFAVKYGGPEVKRQAETRFDGARRLAEETFSGLIVARSGGGDDDVTPAPTPVAPAAPVKKSAKREKADEPAKVEPPASAPKAKAPKPVKSKPTSVERTVGATAANGSHRESNGKVTSVDHTNGSRTTDDSAEIALAIPEYDQLSASQVVERLDGLTPAELDAVRTYELAHRGRNTILGKITQLTS